MNHLKSKMGILASFLLGGLSMYAQSQTTLSGVALKENAGKTMEVWNSGAVSLLGSNANLMVPVAKDGSFQFTFSQSKPAYYSVGYNTVYLTPGQTLHGIYKEDNRTTVFTGTAKVANDYLRKVVSSHSGSYLSVIGQDHLQDTAQVRRQIEDIAAKRRVELQALKGKVPADFWEQENARISADVINSYFSVPFYAGFEKEATIAYLKQYQGKLIPLIKSISYDKYLEVDAVRDALFSAAQNPLFADAVDWQPRMKTLAEAMGYSNLLSQKLDAKGLAKVDSFIQGCPDADFKAALLSKREQAVKLMEGKVAIDLAMKDKTGKVAKLSDYKGKVLVIDCWATWCGPCMRESPLFHALADKYKGNTQVQFLSVSIDEEAARWKNFIARKASSIPEYITTDAKGLSAWGLETIPRFIVIDKAFRIVDAFAPAPSQGTELVNVITQTLKK